MTSDIEGFLYQILSIILFSYLNSWERASISLFQFWVLNKGTTGTIFITFLVWRCPWLGIEQGPPALEASTLPLGYRGGGVDGAIFAFTRHCSRAISYLIQCYLTIKRCSTKPRTTTMYFHKRNNHYQSRLVLTYNWNYALQTRCNWNGDLIVIACTMSWLSGRFLVNVCMRVIESLQAFDNLDESEHTTPWN